MPTAEDGCWECGAVGVALHHHHVVPRSRGGTRTVPLCEACHAHAHHRAKRMSTSALTRAAMAHKKAQGQRVGAVPYGYALADDGQALVELPSEQAVIADARRLHSSGLSLRKVAAELARLGFKPRNGASWYAQQVKRMVAPIQAAG